jgi:hypothetical protein
VSDAEAPTGHRFEIAELSGFPDFRKSRTEISRTVVRPAASRAVQDDADPGSSEQRH